MEMKNWPHLLGLCFYIKRRTIENKGENAILAETRHFIQQPIKKEKGKIKNEKTEGAMAGKWAKRRNRVGLNSEND
jgi:hypothetical protein